MATTQIPADLITSTIDYLCSDDCLPRLPGTPGGDAARRFVEARFSDIGLEAAGEDGYLQPIPGIGGANVIGHIPGRSERHVVIGAHFDACAIDGGVNVGASDNAASVGILVEVARRLAEGDPLERGLVVLGLDAEEPPFFQGPTMGSRHYVANPTVPLDSIDLMICLDMVGHAIGDGADRGLAQTVVAFGAEKSPEVASALARTPEVAGLTVRRLDVDLIDQVSDHAAFEDAGVPFLFYNALRNEHYHAPTDTPATLMPSKLAALADHLIELIRTLDAEPGRFTFDAENRDPARSIATLTTLSTTLPERSRFATRAASLLTSMAERDDGGRSEGDWQVLRRVLLAIEEGLTDPRLWEPADTSPPRGRDLRPLIEEALARDGGVVVVTGAGVSAESGLRTYRGDNGLWTAEGQDAMMKATAAFFLAEPRRSWEWYLARRTEAHAAEPNAAHHAIAELGRLLPGRFTLIAQNIDRLHPRAGSHPEETIELHGHLEGMRCVNGCSGIWPIPAVFDGWTEDDELDDDHVRILVCPECHGHSRPHVLWFDEFYDEENYGFNRAQRAVAHATLCITAGTSGGVPVAQRLAGIAARAGATLIDVNTRDNPLRSIAARRGSFIEGHATEAMQQIAAIVRDLTANLDG